MYDEVRRNYRQATGKGHKRLGASTSESFEPLLGVITCDAPLKKRVFDICHRSLSVNQTIINPSIDLPQFLKNRRSIYHYPIGW